MKISELGEYDKIPKQKLIGWDGEKPYHASAPIKDCVSVRVSILIDLERTVNLLNIL